MAEERGQDYKVLGCFFSKRTHEGVGATHDRWIADEHTGLKEKKRERERGRWRLLPEGKEATTTQPLTAAWRSLALGVRRPRVLFFILFEPGERGERGEFVPKQARSGRQFLWRFTAAP